jgi:hypothetical protein
VGVVISTSVARSPVPWHLGAIWTVFFLAFPIVFTGLVMRILTGAGVEFGSVQIRVVSFLIYGVVGCGIGAALVWLWASRRGVVGEIFAFRFPSARDWLVAIAGFVVGVAIFFPLSQWLARELFGADLRGMDYDLHAPFEMPAMICAVVIVAPFTEVSVVSWLGPRLFAQAQMAELDRLVDDDDRLCGNSHSRLRACGRDLYSLLGRDGDGDPVMARKPDARLDSAHSQ